MNCPECQKPMFTTPGPKGTIYRHVHKDNSGRYMYVAEDSETPVRYQLRDSHENCQASS